jgi:hypothetical protein
MEIVYNQYETKYLFDKNGNRKRLKKWPDAPLHPTDFTEFEYIEITGKDGWRYTYPVRHSIISANDEIIFEKKYSKIHRAYRS